LSPQQLFTWRREARKAAETFPAFVPAVVTPEPAPASEPSAPPSRPKRCGRQRRAAVIEVDVAGVRVTIENGASPATIAAVIGALKAGS
jgi:transposase